MAQFSELGTRQLYVVNKVAVPAGIPGEGKLKGDTAKTQAWLGYESTGGVVRSTIIDKSKIRYITVKDADDQSLKGKACKVTLDATVNAGAPIAGQDYILNVEILNFISPSPEHRYHKFGLVHAHAGMTAAKFYAMLAVSLFDNFKREAYPMLKFGVIAAGEDGADGAITWITQANKSDLSTLIALSGVGVVIDELPQDWELGAKRSSKVDYVVQPTTVTLQGSELVWGVVEDADSTMVLANGQMIADMEYFYKGNRGDQYRKVGFPFTIPYKGIADPSAKYSTIDIIFYKQGVGVEAEMSENTITIACPKATTGTTKNAVANAVIADLKTFLGVTIADLPNA